MFKPVLVTVAVLALAVAGAAYADSPYNFATHLTGDAERPTARDTPAQGQALVKIAKDEQSLLCRLEVSNIENVVQAHIHLGSEDQAGPVVAFLYGLVPAGGGRTDGRLSEVEITAANLRGPLAGRPIGELIEKIRAGEAYVNVHTNDGVAPTDTGPGDFPGGEVRGQL